MRRRSGGEDGSGTEMRASVTIAGEHFVASPDRPLVFGRADGDGVVGLHADDMGISAIAGSLELAWGVWWVINQSTKRPLLLEHPGGTTQLRLAPGHRHALTTDRVDVLVPGAIYTHVLEVVLPEAYVDGLRGGQGALTTGTLTGAAVSLSDRERDALAALCAGYLESFPHRREHPNTYEDAARLLGGEPWTADKVRKAVERVKDRFAAKQNVYFQGPQANYDLTANLVASGVLSGQDLARLPGKAAVMSTQFWVGPAHEPDRIRLGPAAASGAEGVLYRGYVDLPDGSVPLAVKMLHPGHLARLEEWTARWRDQVRLLRQVEIPGLVAVRGGFVGPLPHAPGQADDSTATLYLVMEWVDGVSLDQWARSLVDPEPEQLLLALVPVAAALDLLHSGAATGGLPVMHRDVKPANILVRPEGDTVLVDLGSVRGLAGGHGRASLVGTAGYIAPEVLADGRYGSAADRYSLGAVAYFLLTGEEPVARPEPGELRRRLLDAPLVHGRAELADHVATMLDPDPDRRPECLANWVAQLRRSSLVGLSGELGIPQRAPARNPSAPRTLTADPATRTGRRRAAGIAAAAVAAIALAIAAFAAVLDGDDPNLVAAEQGQPDVTVAGETTTTSTLPGPTTTGEVSTTVVPVTTTSPPLPTTRVATSTVPTVAPPTTVAADPGPRAVPVITVANESYTVEVHGSYDSGTRRMSGSIRRPDVRGVTSTGAAASDYTASWAGDFGRRCLTAGGSGANFSGPNALSHVYGFGVVGFDAVKVELVTAAGPRLPATLAQQPFAPSVRWWIADYASEIVTSVVATDSTGQTWTVPSGPAGIYGQTGC